MYRDHTKVIQIGDRKIGGGNPILIQSMTNTKTEDVEQTVAQILALEQAGCDIIRCAVPTMEAAKALKEIKKQIHIPLVADIHFDYRLAIAAMENGADKIRINPGNIGSTERIKAVVDVAKERGIPIRVGVNSGSLGYSFRASVRHVQGNRLLQEKPVRFLRYKHVYHLRLPAFLDVQMLHSYRLYNKFPYCFSHIFHVLYCDIHLYYEVHHNLLFSLSQLFYTSFLLPMLPRLLQLPMRIQVLNLYFYS